MALCCCSEQFDAFSHLVNQSHQSDKSCLGRLSASSSSECQLNYCGVSDLSRHLKLKAWDSPRMPDSLGGRNETNSPSTARPSSPPWWCTETPSTWQTGSCQSWWSHCLDLASLPCTRCRWWGIGARALRSHMELVPPLLLHLQRERETANSVLNLWYVLNFL